MKPLTFALALCISGCASTDMQTKAANATAAQGESEYNNGSAFLYGDNEPKNPKAALPWFEKAALHGNTNAQYAIGWMYQTGEGVPRNNELSQKWISTAANNGNMYAQFNLAITYGMQGKYDVAVPLLIKAGDQGHDEAQLLLGKIFASGTEIGTDYFQAKKWLERSVAQGNQEAKKLLQELPKLCGSLADVFFVITTEPQRDCTYTNAPRNGVMVDQVSPNGVLVGLIGTPGQQLFIYKSRQFGSNLVDGIPLPAGSFKYVGPYTYNSIFGPRTVYSFKPI